MYDNKEPWYFGFLRKDIAPLLPEVAGRVLEIGCGGGATLNWLKETGRAQWTAGIELSPKATAVARGRMDTIYEGDVDQHLQHFEPKSLDLVLCLDVLEHLVDPWVTMGRLNTLLRPGGHIIVSLPNVQHHSVVLPLLLRGRWRYTEAGIMDQTHLRFFSREGALEMLRQSGLEPQMEHVNYAWGSWDKWKDLATLRLLRGLWAYQFLLRAEKPALAVPHTRPAASCA
jgi:2-polyprenyl-3-methyl-5-hydroxy-6-metoxy-1,4-benzoquinol methylase